MNKVDTIIFGMLGVMMIAVLLVPIGREIFPDYEKDMGAIHYRFKEMEDRANVFEERLKALEQIGVEITVIEGIPVIVEMKNEDIN